MSHHRRTKIQRENDLAEIAAMHLKGVPQREIAANFNLKQPQISKDIAEIYRRWAEKNPIALSTLKARELARIDELERTYWKAWEDSQKPREVEFQEKTSIEPDVSEDGAATAGKDRLKASRRTEGQVGNPAFLAGISKCGEQRCKLIGLDAPQQLEVRTPQPIQIINVMDAEPRPTPVAEPSRQEHTTTAPPPLVPIRILEP
jgi:hypothetical protein